MTSAKGFKASWWSGNRHIQTVFPLVFRRQPVISLTRERVRLPDGDFLDLDWAPTAPGPVVLVLHGLGGSIDSHYMRGMLQALHQVGYQACAMHARGASGSDNLKPYSYHGGWTHDLEYVSRLIQDRYQERSIAAVGFSMGGSILLNEIGRNSKTPFRCAIAVSVPLLLSDCASRLDLGVSRVYRRYLINCQRSVIKRKLQRFPHLCDRSELEKVKSFWQFDDLVTAPTHGFRNAREYYRECSARQVLRRIKIPTLLIHASDDPFMSDRTIPAQDEISPQVTLEVSRRGGHVGFITGRWPWRPVYWLEKRALAFLKEQLQ